jgi:rod shape-determining protein MreC
MGRLLELLIENRNRLVFGLLVFLSFMLLVNFNSKQEAVYTEFSLEVKGYFQELNNSAIAFINLRGENDRLQMENIGLRKELSAARNELMAYKYRIPFTREFSALPDSVLPMSDYLFLPCRLVHSSVESNYNYLTINLGRRNGVTVGMGLVSPKGIVGRVVAVSENYAVAISLLNKHFRLNAKVRGSDIQGTFHWTGGDTRLGDLDYVPLHLKVQVGDTVVSSNYSTIFPEGFLLGYVESVDPREPDGFYEIKVRMQADFHRLDYLYLVRNLRSEEMDELFKQLP